MLFLGTLAFFELNGCAGLVSSSNANNIPAPVLQITNVVAASATPSASQILWTTNTAADSVVDYGTSTSYGSTTPTDPTMVTSHQVTLSGLTAGTTYYYQVRSTDSKNDHANSGGHSFKTADPAVVAPTITTPPTSQTVIAGQAATFTVVASGTAPLSYQWQKNGANIAGATAASYTTPATTAGDSGSTFNVVVANSVGSVTSVTASLTVSAAPVAPTITTQPANQTVIAGQTATFTVVASGTAPLSYQWQKNGANIAGATAASYTTPAATTTDNGSIFGVIVKNGTGSVTSNAVTLTVSAAPVAPTITTQPASQTVTAGQTATFTVVANGTAPLSYQWQKDGTNIAGATAASYTTPATATTDSGSTFDVVVTNSVSSVTSATATLTVNAAPAPAVQVSSSSINFGNGVVGTTTSQVLTIKNTGTATLSITQINETGAAFSTSGYSLPMSINAGQQTTITVAFLPTTVGSASGNLSLVSNAPTSPTAISLSGTGIAATLTLTVSPTSLSFGNVTTNTISAPQVVTVTNAGNANVTISQITLTGAGYSMTGGSAPVTLSPTQNITLSITFGPTTAGVSSGSISLVSNATGSPATVSLTGTGVAPVQHSVVLTWNASTSTVSGYNVYRSTVSGGPYTKINSALLTVLTYTDSTVQSGTTYYYVATAVDSSGNESVNSNEVSATIP
ncbi:MAG TPA: choice-of-anchor D domain-containing protein [Candidatus Methylomirabilis sp.]|nr:choice-of-anchor D domain-containing protein [Candidatus Methylomirabilis sp.]